ncbi:MAG: ABC transporter permease [Mycobacteriaceae bacterium]
MTRRRLWIRWSWRDLQRRWVQVGAIALVIALGTGTYAGLLSTSVWRTQSNDASFAALRLHDLRIGLSEGSTVPEGVLAELARSIPHADDLTGVRERLVVSTQASGPSGLLVPGELVGSALGPDSAVDTVSRTTGRALEAGDDGAPVVVLEQQFAKKNRMPTEGQLLLPGEVPVSFVGQGQSPEYFLLSSRQGTLPFLNQKSFAVLFTSLHSAQRIAGMPGQVNDLVVSVRPGAADVVRVELQRAIAGAQPAFSATVTDRRDVDSYRVLYDDIAGDEQLWRIIALLVYAGAAFAALNLTSRIVEAQRREIGIGMALGLRPRALALRPVLFGAQVALIGVVLGLVVGWLIGIPLRSLFIDMLPLPVWRTPFQTDIFAQAAALGFLLPFAAVAWPVWRAVRMEPVEAIRVGHLAGRSSPHVDVLRRLRLPGHSYRRIPLRNVLRTPRRTLMTTLGIAAAVTTFVTTIGFLDSFNATLDTTEQELLHAAPNRVSGTLRTMLPEAGSAVDAVRHLPGVGTVHTGLLVPVTAHSAGRSIDLLTEVLGPDAPWTPTIVRGKATGGLVLARKADTDLQLQVGDTVTVEHPQATADGLRTVSTVLPVVGLQVNPMRVMAYLDEGSAQAYGLSGMTNVLTVIPTPGTSTDSVRRALLAVPQVASAEAASTTTEGMRSALQEYIGILQVAAGVTLLLALLIAFNTASIGMDERSRDHATMLAFGLPARTVMTMAMIEMGVIGLLATGVGIAGGYVLLSWLTQTTLADVLPDIEMNPALATNTVLWALALGVATVALAPLLTVRRLCHMDIPATLRVLE